MTDKELDELFDKLDQPQFIPGIYNYCDRWCERCAHTHECSSYMMEKGILEDNTTTSDSEDDLFDSLKKIFSTTIALIEKMAKEEGIDLEMTAQEEAEFKREQKKKRADTKAKPLFSISKAYGVQGQNWFEEQNTWLKDKEDEINEAIDLELPNTYTQKEAARISECLEVIQFYSFFIHAKFARALHSLGEFNADSKDGWLEDEMNGTAKVAMIATERSIAAWHQLMIQYQEQEDEILPKLVQLSKIKKLADKIFPKAMAHIRPGLDEEE